MLLQEVGWQNGKRERGLVVLRARGGLEDWIANPEAPRTLEALEVLVLNEADSRAPGADGEDVDSAFVRRVVSKLKYVLRHFGDLDIPHERKEAIFLRSVAMECRRTNQERRGRFLDPSPTSQGEAELDLQPGKEARQAETWHVSQSTWWRRLKSRVPSRLAKRAATLAAWIEGQRDVEAVLSGNGEFDVEGISSVLRCSRRETREILGCWQREVKAMMPDVPRRLNRICRKLEELISAPYDGLADSDLRERLFEISRSLAYSFGSVKVRARAVRELDLPGFDDSIDLLLDERSFSESPIDRGVLERLLQSLVCVRDAIRDGDVDRAFAHGAALICDVARLQHYKSPERLQVVLAYSHFLYLAGAYGAFYEVNEAIETRANALAPSPGSEVWDRCPEFAGGETLRRVRTYARLNQITCLFYRECTTAARERFQVRSFEELRSLDDRLCRAMADDPQAASLCEELLIVRTHLVRAAYNLGRRAKESEKERMRAQYDHCLEATRALIQNEFTDRHTGLPDVPRIIRAVRSAGEGFAVERALDVLEELFADLPDTVYHLAHERASRIGLCF